MVDEMHLADTKPSYFEKVKRDGCRRYLVIGLGSRARMFIEQLAGLYRENNCLVGFCDISTTRMRYAGRQLGEQFGAPEVLHFHADDFDLAVAATNATHVIICSPDCTHADYAVRAMQLGCDVICEKPIATTHEGCAAVLETARKTGRQFRLTFNYRWSPGVSQVRDLIAQGAIGRVRTVHFEYKLDLRHGADYFRRWHSNKAVSSGLLVHKSTHHFDLVNWWLDAIPAQVFAYGDLAYYGRKNAIQRGDEAWTTYPRYTGHALADDPFAFSLDKDFFREAYLEAEKESGYIRDQNVFRDDITIEDTMSVMVKYRAGQTLAYTLTAFNSIEGLFVSLIGDRGRIEYSELHQGAGMKPGPRLLLMPHFQNVQEIPVHLPEEGHGGGDAVLGERIFGSHNHSDPLGRDAGVEQGIISALTGMAANLSIESNLPVNLSELVSIGPEAVSLHELV